MFHPRHRSQAMRERLSGGFPSAPILVYVGRLGARCVAPRTALASVAKFL